ncbi:pentatricopeptide repeat-containing protein At3g29230-like [Rutidosis leptorrhynchoides]|uniref:pentatricopeptide repeat-containing protein At3g29230-like n=1 Tax=Rutidosis leptorrhynchoides TaxID=125765 RepID=UPI003A998C4A
MLMQHEMLKLLLNKCKTVNHLKQAHLQIIINGGNKSLLHNLITLSSDLISLNYAFKILQTSNLSNLDVIAYNTLIKCFFSPGNERNCNTRECNPLSVYKEMKKKGFLPNSFTFTFLLKCCDDNLDAGRMIHGDVLKMGFDVSSLFVGNSLLNLYGKYDGGVDMACKVFDEMPERDIVSWNTMIRMRMDCGDVGVAIELFESMPERSNVTWNCVITGLVNNANMEYARELFDKMPDKNEVSWNCMISGYIKMGDLSNAEHLFNEMPLVKKSVVTCTAIISGYASNGEIEKARKMFDRMEGKRNVVTWNAMIAGYVNKSVFDEALSLFHMMLVDGKCKPDQITLISVLSACSHLGSLENGKWISAYINKNKIHLSTPLGNALIDMFAKCGDIESSKAVFHQMGLNKNRCIITWTTMVAGLSLNGMCKQALELYNDMCVEGTTKPDDVMFIAVLSACNHGGLVKEGKRLFNEMIHSYKIKPQIEHYGCMIDLIARSGDLDEAVRLTENMQDVKPNAVIWGTLIGACKVHGNSKLFEYVTKKVLDQEPANPSYLTLITNLSSSIGRWQDALRFRLEMRQKGVEKVPGCSSIQIGDSVHEFVATDTIHMQRSDIYGILESLNGHLWLQSDVEL